MGLSGKALVASLQYLLAGLHLNPADPPLPVETPRESAVTLKNLGMASLLGASQLAA